MSTHSHFISSSTRKHQKPQEETTGMHKTHLSVAKADEPLFMQIYSIVIMEGFCLESSQVSTYPALKIHHS